MIMIPTYIRYEKNPLNIIKISAFLWNEVGWGRHEDCCEGGQGLHSGVLLCGGGGQGLYSGLLLRGGSGHGLVFVRLHLSLL